MYTRAVPVLGGEAHQRQREEEGHTQVERTARLPLLFVHDFMFVSRMQQYCMYKNVRCVISYLEVLHETDELLGVLRVGAHERRRVGQENPGRLRENDHVHERVRAAASKRATTKTTITHAQRRGVRAPRRRMTSNNHILLRGCSEGDMCDVGGGGGVGMGQDGRGDTTTLLCMISLLVQDFRITK